jgi:large subunit ribosomal protein L5
MSEMKKIKVEKVTLNMGAGKDQKQLERSVKLLKNLTGVEPIKTTTEKRIQGWGLRPGLAIGAKITLRGKEAQNMVERLVYAKDNVLKQSSFDDFGNISFGISEYVDIKDAKYDVDIGMTGLQASITLARPGYRVQRKALRPGKLSRNHRVNKEEAIKFMEEEYNIKLGESA